MRWRSASPDAYWVEDDLHGTLPGFAVVPAEVAENVDWILTDRRIILVAAGRSRVSAGVLHLRHEWTCGRNAERYAYPDDHRPATLALTVVSGRPGGRRAAVRLNPGMAEDPLSEQLLLALDGALDDFGLVSGATRRRVSDNGRKGKLTWEFRPWNGGGLAVPATLIE